MSKTQTMSTSDASPDVVPCYDVDSSPIWSDSVSESSTCSEEVPVLVDPGGGRPSHWLYSDELPRPDERGVTGYADGRRPAMRFKGTYNGLKRRRLTAKKYPPRAYRNVDSGVESDDGSSDDPDLWSRGSDTVYSAPKPKAKPKAKSKAKGKATAKGKAKAKAKAALPWSDQPDRPRSPSDHLFAEHISHNEHGWSLLPPCHLVMERVRNIAEVAWAMGRIRSRSDSVSPSDATKSECTSSWSSFHPHEHGAVVT
jgi:hypothetical protein